MFCIFTVTVVASSNWTCANVKDLYLSSSCCGNDPSHPVSCSGTEGAYVAQSNDLGLFSPSSARVLSEEQRIYVAGEGTQGITPIKSKVYDPETETAVEKYKRYVSEFEVLWNGMGWPIHNRRWGWDFTEAPMKYNNMMNKPEYDVAKKRLLDFIARVYDDADSEFYADADENTQLKMIDLKNALEIARKMSNAYKQPTMAFSSTIFDSDDVFASRDYFTSMYGLVEFGNGLLAKMSDPANYGKYIQALYMARDGVERVREKVESNINKGIQTFKYAQEMPLFSSQESSLRDIYKYGAAIVTDGKAITGSWWDVYQTPEFDAWAQKYSGERYQKQFMARSAESLVNTTQFPVSDAALATLSSQAKMAFDTYFNTLHGFYPLFDKYVALGRDNVNDRIGCLGLYPENRYKAMVANGLMSQGEMDAAFDAHAEECKDKFIASIHFSSGIDTDVSGISWINDANQAKQDLIAAATTMQGYFQKALANHLETMDLTTKENAIYTAMTKGSNGGSPAQASVNVGEDGEVKSVSMTNYGVGYVEKPVVVIEGDGAGAQAEVLEEFFAGKKVWKTVVTAPGSGYTAATARFVGETSQARVSLTVNSDGTLGSVSVDYAGSNHVSVPDVVVTGCATAPVCHCELAEDKTLKSVMVHSAGSGCTSDATATIVGGHPLNDIADFMSTIESNDVDTFTYGNLTGVAKYDEITRQSNEFNRKCMLAMDYVSYQEDIDGLYGMPEMVVMSVDSNARFSITHGRNYVVGKTESRSRIENMNLAEAIPSHLYQEYRFIPKSEQDFVGNFGIFSWRESFSNTQIQQLSSAYGVVSGDYNEAEVIASTGEVDGAFDLTFDRDHQLKVGDVLPGLYIGLLEEQGDYISQLKVTAVPSSTRCTCARMASTRQEKHFVPDPDETTKGDADLGIDHTYASKVTGLDASELSWLREEAPQWSYATADAFKGYKVHLPRTNCASNTESSVVDGMLQFSLTMDRLYTRAIKPGDLFHLRNKNTLKTLPGGDFAFDNLDYHIVVAVNGPTLTFKTKIPIAENSLTEYFAIYLHPERVVQHSIAGQLYALSILWGDVGCNMDIGEKVTYDNFAEIIALAGQGIGRVEQRPRRYCTSIAGSQPYDMGVKFFSNLWQTYVDKSPNTANPKVFFKLALQSPRRPWAWYSAEVDRITSEAEAAYTANNI